MKQKFLKFMSGRYGADQLSRFTLTISLVFWLVSLLTKLDLLYFLAIGLMIYTYFRMFSKNISKRYGENQKFLTWKYRMIAKANKKKQQWAQRKVYRFFTCPTCKQKVRVPRGKGRICITCPKCKTEFIQKS